MDRLSGISVFSRIAATRNFSAAARELGISQASASKHVQELEAWLGTRLLNRTTRRVSLTATGETFYAQCIRILDDMEAARQLAQPVRRLRGNLRFTAPVSFGSTRLAPLLAAFMKQNPGLALTVTLVDRPVDVIEEGYDLALQIVHGNPAETSVPGVAQPLMEISYTVCASQAYLDEAGVPATPEDLKRHRCLTDKRHPGDVWRFTGSDGVAEITVSGGLRCDNGLLRREAACAGAGVLLAPLILVENDITSGRLIRLLPDYQAQVATLVAVYPASRAALPQLRSLIGFLAAGLTDASEAV